VTLHPRIGSRLVEQVPALRPMTDAILHHHERFDGDGYPARLEGKQIPLAARIICVADAFSAMTAERPYRSRMPAEEACRELERCAGTQFDPTVVDVFVEAVRARPPGRLEGALAPALDDPEVRALLGRQPLLGLSAQPASGAAGADAG
jgi:HD-GYP domain-containing protein (c-di-GMP phosphodiesterase class II)